MDENIKTIDTGCPWCGEELVQASDSQNEYERQMEGHAMECEPFLAEMGA